MKKSKLLLIAGVLGAAYLVYLITHFVGGTVSSADDMEMIAGGIATALVMPHMVCVGVAVLFNIIGWGMNARWAALVAGIMYAVAIVCMFLYALFVVLQMILCFVAFAKMKKPQLPLERNSLE